MSEIIPEEYKRTVKSALNMLAYADCTANQLEKKLTAKGYSQESIEFAVNYALQRGYLNEKRYLERFIEQLANTKLYGLNRIALEIYKKGFSLALVRDNLGEFVKNIDFEENCIKLAQKNKRSDRNKLYEYLIRAGHTGAHAAKAVKIVLSQANDDQI
ncbi:MAG: regulatory protein RecX [Ruminococcaceae bacterium]|nr:regulatory protein RecX [Oscillospiraceae bacterium]